MSNATPTVKALRATIRAMTDRVAAFRAKATAVSASGVTIRRHTATKDDAAPYARIRGFGINAGEWVQALPNGGEPVILGAIDTGPPAGYALDAALTITSDSATALIVEQGDGDNVFQVDAANLLLRVANGAPLGGYSDNGITRAWQLESATGHLLRGGGAPSAVAETAAGTGATVSIAGSADDCFRLVLVTGSSGLGAGTLATVTFANARASSEYMVSLNPGDSDSAASGVWPEYSSRSTTQFTINCRAALPANRSHIWLVQIGEAL